MDERSQRNGRTAVALAVAACLGVGAATAAAEPAAPAFPEPLPSHRGRLGIEVQPLTPELREHFGAPRDRGVLVARVEAGRAGQRAGLRVGDVLTEAGGEPLAAPRDLVRVVIAVPEGESLELRLVRDGKQRELRAQPELAPYPALPPEAWEGWDRWFSRGMRQGSRELREKLDELERRLERLERQLDDGPGKAT